MLLPKGKSKGVTAEFLIDDIVPAPVKTGDRVGVVRYSSDGKVIGEGDISAAEDVCKISYFQLLLRMMGIYCFK